MEEEANEDSASPVQLEDAAAVAAPTLPPLPTPLPTANKAAEEADNSDGNEEKNGGDADDDARSSDGSARVVNTGTWRATLFDSLL